MNTLILVSFVNSWGCWLTCPPLFQDEGVRGREREERPPDPRARQEEQPVGGEGKVRHHVERLLYPGLAVFCTYAVSSVVRDAASGEAPQPCTLQCHRLTTGSSSSLLWPRPSSPVSDSGVYVPPAEIRSVIAKHTFSH